MALPSLFVAKTTESQRCWRISFKEVQRPEVNPSNYARFTVHAPGREDEQWEGGENKDGNGRLNMIRRT